MEILLCILSAVTIVFLIILLTRRSGTSETAQLSAAVTAAQKAIGEMQSDQLAAMNRRVEDLKTQLERQLTEIRRENNAQLERMQKTVDEKLQETLDARISKSFSIVNERLEQVYKGLGEMQTIARSVGDLKKVFSNVKTRGILGEMQLGAILSEILAPEQYTENIATVPGSRNVVEFAIRLPDSDGAITYMPIDSKFPADTYSAFLEAQESGDKQKIDAASRLLRQRILSEARDIHEKYVSPPYTTDFAIMFLPTEGLYAEAVNRGLIEELQSTYKIMLAGPSTMAAMLSSIRMGFKTIAIEKRSAEVWEILGAVKTEFGKFSAILDATRKRLNQANDELDKLVGVRTRAIVKKLSSVEQLDSDNYQNDIFEED
ncbi:MAG: DNA recombination protein RmuC [Oscillospiraceae bacterium]|nr:DNA recombination protein RmuC [Oscillospiraceae bacterium]